MKMRTKVLAGAMIALGVAAPSQASLLFTLQQVGSDVVASASGSANLGGLAATATTNLAALLWGDYGLLGLGSTTLTSVNVWDAITGPTNFGVGGNYFGSSGSGTPVGFYGGGGSLYLPSDYVSGTALSSTSTWTGVTFSSLGVTPGTYDWTWGTGGNADSARLVIGDAPEPATLALLAAGLAGLARARWQRRSAA
ncbi:PEP-CTERM sorting domain-containing protein [uncultured Thiodictyon sp.]|jgi:hypothetical protein|uniref:PEP-CTERM sorting domain-containing protein n=1 Tax=uncultured Thiodictyon sp. TaxID=1846217 RepID=UPI0025EC068D|nr:PEP-CTERM sorting domain-containing protein [uncultured Thiodictyon sp.]